MPFEIPVESIADAKRSLLAAQTLFDQDSANPDHLMAIADAQVRCGRALLRAGEALQAMPFLRDAVANFAVPDIRSMTATDILRLADARSVLGDGYRFRGDYLNAAREYGRALSELNVVPERISTLSLRAVIKEKIGDAALAEDDWEKAAAAFDSAQVILESLSDQEEDDVWLRGLAIILDKQGMLLQSREDWESAETCFLRARHYRRRLAEDPTATDEAVCDLIISQQRLGDLYFAQQLDEKALFSYAAAELFLKTHLKNPHAESVARLQATIAEHRAKALLRRKEMESAADALAMSLKIRERLYDQTKTDAALANLAKTRGRIGDLKNQQARKREALELYRLADDHLRSLAIRDWADPLRQANWAASALRVGDAARKCGDSGIALKAYRQASSIRERLVRRDPTVLSRRRDLAITRERTASMLKAMCRHEAAIRMLQTGIEDIEAGLRFHPKHPLLRRDLVILSHQLYELASTANDHPTCQLWRSRTRTELKSLADDGVEFDEVLQTIQAKLAESMEVSHEF